MKIRHEPVHGRLFFSASSLGRSGSPCTCEGPRYHDGSFHHHSPEMVSIPRVPSKEHDVLPRYMSGLSVRPPESTQGNDVTVKAKP